MRNHIILCCVISLLCGCHTEAVSERAPRHDELMAKGLVSITTITMPKMTFERKPLSDILSSVYKQCNLRLTEEWGFGVGLTFSGVDLDERYDFEIPALTICEVFYCSACGCECAI